MILLRGTEALRRKLKREATAPPSGVVSTTALGDWYGHVIRPARRSMLLFISEHSRLPVLLPIDALRGSRLETALPSAVREVLVAIGIDRARIDREVAEMTPVVVAKTASRSLVGTLNEFAWLLHVVNRDDDEEDDLARALRLADTPIMAMGGKDPKDRTRRILSGEWSPEPKSTARPAPAARGRSAGTPGPTRVFTLKVTLEGARPPIWRRLAVPAGISLARLHAVLQIAMGWTDSHLHMFERQGATYGVPDPEFGIEQHDERRARLDDVLRRQGDWMEYEYDFGDSWTHRILLEQVDEGVETGTAAMAVVLKAKGACPPEDCGGVWGYAAILEALRNPRDEDARERLEWLGDGFDPTAFDIEAVNRTLRRVKVSELAPRPARRQSRVERILAGPEAPSPAFREKLKAKLEDPAAILNDPEVRYLASQVAAALPSLPESLRAAIPTAEDVVRWSAVAARCRQVRDERGWTTKDVAGILKVARYRIDAVEKGPARGYVLEVAVRYFRLLGLETWIARWARSNPDLARRQGLGR